MAETYVRDTVDVLALARQALPAREFDILAKEINQPLDVALRVNRLKVDPARAIRDWAEWYGWEYESVPFCPSGFRLRKTRDQPGTTISHRMGCYYIQEAASMLPAELFDLSILPKDALILDMAASPGGKTTHLADRTSDRGLIVANDASRGRIPALEIVLRNWGVINQAVTCLPGERFGDTYESFFNAVLLDAPCSMQGLRGADSHAMRPVTLNEIQSLSARQTRLLESALRAVKPGGQVVYSTCTLTAQENEGVLTAILARFPRQVEILDAHAKVTGASFGLDEYEEMRLPLSVSRAARLWPHNLGTAGFFCAVLAKKDHLPPANDSRNLRFSPPQPRYRALNRAQAAELVAGIHDMYGFSIDQVIAEQSLRVYEINEQIFLMPALLQEKMEGLPWISCGLLLGKKVAGSLQPSHEFVARFGDQFRESVLVLDDQFVESWLRGEDLRGYSSPQTGQGAIVAVRDRLGRNLGRGKLLSDRLKNMLPTRLF